MHLRMLGLFFPEARWFGLVCLYGTIVCMDHRKYKETHRSKFGTGFLEAEQIGVRRPKNPAQGRVLLDQLLFTTAVQIPVNGA